MIPARKPDNLTFLCEVAARNRYDAPKKFSENVRHRKGDGTMQKAMEEHLLNPHSTTGDVAVISKRKLSRRTAKKMPHTAGGYLADCESLPKMELRRRYKSGANSHRNMLSREKSHVALIHPDFRDFASFLRLVGPKPAVGATLDRIDNDDPEYAPGKVRWADKRTQNNNKSDTLTFFYSRTGETYTTSRLAKLRGYSPATIRKQRERGWSDDEIIEGKRHREPVAAGGPAKTRATAPRTPM